ncbi:AAA family ATPase [Methylotenera mobilis]|jgi:predicted kinase|uniref:AAA family ATPase n=1 Tax=Methylotenera mobilis TaxID=359408 RepID=UPI00037DA502|nr:AAA family ATPase [Methylotenera mobilis]
MEKNYRGTLMSGEKRTHKERLTMLREVFGRRQEIARNSGKKHDVSIAKICADAKVDKVYLFGHRLKEEDPVRGEYLALKEEILKFQKNIGVGIERSEDRLRADDLKNKYDALLADVEPLQRELAYYKSASYNDRNKLDGNRERMTDLLARIADLEVRLANSPKSTNLGGSFAARVQKHVVSPDMFRVVGGKYRIGSKKQEEDAWGNAYMKLEELLSRKLKMRLYLLVGLPCSGKTTWAVEGEVAVDRHPVIWDATNLSSMDRFRLVISLSRFNDLPKTCVFFDTDMEIIRERNRTLRMPDKRVSDDDLTVMRNKLQRPDPYEEVWIDELIVVRSNHE